VWGFQWFAKGVHTLAGGERSMLFVEPASDTLQQYRGTKPAIDELNHRMRAENLSAQILEVHIPMTAASAIEIAINPDNETYWQTDYRYFDQYTLKELSVDHLYGKLADNNAADKLIRMNYDIHTGAVIGLPGKILAFCGSLIVASLPITGFCIWYGRRKKEKTKAQLKTKKKPVNVPVPVAVH
jgi:uncharacterized iron-regulated membrane protein